MPRETIAVIGAGIGGLVAAISLAQRGFAVSVFERAAALEAVGAGIQLSPKASRVLERLGVWTALRDALVEPHAIVLRDPGSRTILRMSLKNARQRWGAPYGVIHRADLQACLLAAAQREATITVRFGTTFEKLDRMSDRPRFGLRHDDREEILEADALIGADGLWSPVATAFGRSEPPRFAHRRAWRAVLPINAAPAVLREPVTSLWLGPGAHLVAYPLRGGAALNLVATVSSDRPGGGWSEPGRGEDIARLYSGWHADIVRMIRDHTDWRGWPLYDRAEPGPFARGHVALLGDAAHPMLPFLAQGGAMAIEDAAVLAACLDQPGAMTDRLATYGEARHERVARVQREARANGARYHWNRPLSTARNAAMRLAGGATLLRRYDWLYGWRPPLP